MKLSHVTLSILTGMALAGCSGGPSSENFSGNRNGVQTGELTLSITDAAVDGIDQVWIQFSGIELKPAVGPSITYTFDTPKDVNLLELQGSLSEDFFNNLVIPSGTYEWVRLAVNQGAMQSYIRLTSDGSVHELTIPSGSQSGLKIINGFIVAAHTQTAMTIDFDVRRSIVLASGSYKLKPVLRLVENANAGTISGSIDPALTLGANCSDANSITGNAVYVFEGFDAELDDIDNVLPEPITSALLSSTYEYEVGFVPQGNYTVAFTCMADQDDPEQDDAIIFQSSSNVTVSAPVYLYGADSNR